MKEGLIWKLLQLIWIMIQEERNKAIWRGYYVNYDYPKTYGTKIRRNNNE